MDAGPAAEVDAKYPAANCLEIRMAFADLIVIELQIAGRILANQYKRLVKCLTDGWVTPGRSDLQADRTGLARLQEVMYHCGLRVVRNYPKKGFDPQNSRGQIPFWDSFFTRPGER
jgi:hypothetical protein